VSSGAGLESDPDYGGREIIHRRYDFRVQQLNAAIEQTLRSRMATRESPARVPIRRRVTTGARPTSGPVSTAGRPPLLEIGPPIRIDYFPDRASARGRVVISGRTGSAAW
jgi:hypothetical protein